MLHEGTILNPDADTVKAIKKQIKANNGYCPCQPYKNADTKCQCKTYRESGYCYCGLYIKDISSLVDEMFK